MKTPSALIAAAALTCGSFVSPGAAQSSPPDREPIAVIDAVLDYSTEPSDAADEFFEALDAQLGKAVWLNLTIVPGEDMESLGYTLTQPNPADPEQPTGIKCGEDRGFVDNLHTMLDLTFQHPAHFHAPTHIFIGDRIRFPFHSVVCGAEGAAELKPSRLYLTGHFVVRRAEIPTAYDYELSPYDP